MDNIITIEETLDELSFGKKTHLATIGIPLTVSEDGYKRVCWLTESMVVDYVINNKSVRKEIVNVTGVGWGDFDNESSFFYNLAVNAIASKWIFNIESMRRVSKLIYMYMIKGK
jgi:hypothetical protein